VEVKSKNGDTLNVRPLHVDEADDDLGYIFEKLNGERTGMYFKDIESAEIINQNKTSAVFAAAKTLPVSKPV
jgi:predicted RNA-binding protein (virulence factor B family)